jgi:leucyl-tRNA synthetase
VREEFAKTELKNDKELIARVTKMGETKKAMPFVQELKKRLVQGGERPEAVFDRKLAFDEVATLREMVPGLRRTTGCRVVEVVQVDEGGKTGVVVIAEHGVGEKRVGLAPAAEGAKPGTPSFLFENVEA